MQSIGERLEEARKRKGISIREAAESTKIRSDYLQKFENNQYDIRLPEIYVRGFLRSYASFLKLPSDKIIADYNALTHIDPKAGPRTVNREVYGRMDISTTKEPKPDSPSGSGGTAPPMVAGGAAPSTPPGGGTRSPISFLHSAGTSLSQVDKKLLVKAGAIAAATLAALILIFYFVFSGGGGTSTPRANNKEFWLQAQPNEPTFDITAKTGPVTVKVSHGAVIYYQGTLQPGDKRTLARIVGMRIETLDNTPHTNLWLVFDGLSHQMTGTYTYIQPPQ